MIKRPIISNEKPAKDCSILFYRVRKNYVVDFTIPLLFGATF